MDYVGEGKDLQLIVTFMELISSSPSLQIPIGQRLLGNYFQDKLLLIALIWLFVFSMPKSLSFSMTWKSMVLWGAQWPKCGQ